MGADSATPITIGEFLAKLSEFYPYGDEPPRLHVALNDTRTDAPPGTTFDAAGNALEHKANTPYSASTITDILTWVQGRLDQSFVAPWMSQLACLVQWTKPDAAGLAEEVWAQTVAELFLGTTYSGPLQLYNMGAPFTSRNAAGKRPPNRDTESWEQYFFRRIEKRYPRQSFHLEPNAGGVQIAWGAHDLQSWDRPYPSEADAHADEEQCWEMHENTDPASPIGIACQHMTTYGSLVRGVPLDWLGDATNNRVGYMASDACSGLAIFGAPQPSSPYGKAARLVTPPDGGKWVWATPDLQKLETLKQEGFGPGTIVVLDTDSGGKKPGKGSIILQLSKYEQQDHVHREVLKEYFYTRKTVGGSDFSSEWTTKGRKAPAKKYVEKIEAQIAQNEKRIRDREAAIAKKKEALAKAKKQEDIQKLKADIQQQELLLEDAKKQRPYLEAQKKLAADETTSDYEYKFNEQLPGNHIWFVLRVHKDGKAFQAFDVSSGGMLAHLTASNSGVIIKRSGEDIHADGWELKGLSAGEGKQFCGIGVLPPIDPAKVLEQASFARGARPIGLARLVISERVRVIGKKVYPGLADKNQILYVSPLVPMYGPSPGQNYPVSKLMWAIRNTPGFSDLQVWWCISAPQGLLAKSMWAEGARSMTLRQFVDTMAASEDWDCWSFLLPDYFPGIDRSPPLPHLVEQKRKKIRKLLVPELHHRLHIVVANEGDKDPAVAGKVSNVCRYKNGEGNGNRKASPNDPPEPLASVLKNTPWDKVYLRSDLEPFRAEIESAAPPFFQVEPPAPSGTPAA